MTIASVLSFYPFPFDIAVAACLFVLGAGLVSFFQCMAWRDSRRPEMRTARSVCDACGRVVPWYGIVPFVGYWFVRGRCRRCGSRIDLRYPVSEAAGGSIVLILAGSNMHIALFVPYAIFVAIVCAIELMGSTPARQETGRQADRKTSETVWRIVFVLVVCAVNAFASGPHAAVAGTIGGAAFLLVSYGIVSAIRRRPVPFERLPAGAIFAFAYALASL